jgi:hypothetical protein
LLRRKAPLDERSSMFATLLCIDLPGHRLAAVEILKKVEIV